VFGIPQIEAAADIFVRPLTVTLSSPNRTAEVRYTTDGSDPAPTSALYSAPLRLAATTEIKARAFKDGRPVSGLRSRRFELTETAPATAAKPATGGLLSRVYHGEWSKLPDFDSLEPDAVSVAPKIRPANWVDERIGYRFSGFLNIPRDDVYLFELASDDGSRLVLDGRTLIDNDGLHGTATKKAPAALAKGWHPITIEWFNRTGDATLDLNFAAAGDKPGPIPPQMLGHEPLPEGATAPKR